MIRKSGFDSSPMSNEFKGFRPPDPGQNCPQDYPQGTEGSGGSSDAALGEPLNIREVAAILGCSPWTVRHRHVRNGLPHFRVTPMGKLVFYRNQVIRWLLDQQKGGA